MPVFLPPDSGAILYDNYLTDASIVTIPSNQSTLAPASNLLLTRSGIFLLTDNNGGSIVFDLGSARRPTALSIVDTKAITIFPTSAQQWILTGADDAAITVNVIAWQFTIYSNDITTVYLGPDKLAGYVEFNIDNNDNGWGICLDSNNNIIMAASSSTNSFKEVRFTYDGILDTSFGSGTGYVDSSITGTQQKARASVKTAAGKRAVVGRVTSGHRLATIVLYNDNGTVSSSDTEDVGVATSGDSVAIAVAQQASGNIISVGNAKEDSGGGNDRLFFLRYTSTLTGSPTNLHDIAFSLTPFSCAGIAIEPSTDKPIAIGTTGTGAFFTTNMAIARATSNLSGLDTTFGGTGKVELNFGFSIVPASNGVDVVVQSTGRIIGVGNTYYDDPSTGSIYVVWAAAAYTSLGVLDTTWGTDGKWFYNWGNICFSSTALVLSDNSVLIGGSGYKNGSLGLGFIKLKANGAIDTTFGDGGTLSVSIGATDCAVEQIIQLPTGKFLCTGYFQSFLDTKNTAFVLRLNANGTVDTTFAPDQPTDGRRFWQLTLGTSSNTPAYNKIGYLFLGDYVDIRPNMGASITYGDDSKIFESRDGAQYADLNPMSRDISFDVQAASKSELKELREAVKEVGNHKPVILDLMANSVDNIDRATGSCYGYLDSSGFFSIDLQSAQTDNIKIKIKEAPE